MHKVICDKNIQKDEILYDSGILPNRWKTLVDYLSNFVKINNFLIQ